MILPKKKFGSKDQNIAEFKNLVNFDVLSSDFEALKTPCSFIDLIGLRSLTDLTGLLNLYNPFYRSFTSFFLGSGCRLECVKLMPVYKESTVCF